jgi:thiamine biosynthesis lipoprotein
MTDASSAPQARYPSRREILALGVGAFVVAALPLARHRPRLVRRTVPGMGTLLEVAVVHRDAHYAEAAVDAAIAAMAAVERTMTRFERGSDIGRLNTRPSREAVLLSPATATVIRAALDWAQASEGAFDPCLGRVSELWDVEHRHRPPPPAAYRRLAGRQLYRSLDLDTWQGHPAARRTDPDVQVDLGGIAKGYAVDRAVTTLREWGIEQALVNAGGDLYAMGESERGEPWRIGVRDPRDPARLMAVIPLADRAVATSGDYFRYFEYRGRRYHHLMDPQTAAPRLSREHSVSVAAATCMDADAAATAVFGMDLDQAARLLKAHAPGAELVSHA